MATVILDYDKYNVQAQKALENILAMGCFKSFSTEKLHEEIAFLTRKKDDDFLYLVSEQALAKDWLNKTEDEAWQNL